jgi:hypothetical protein
MKRSLKTIICILAMFCLVIILINEAAASVVLKIMATNPSETNTRRVPVKVYLPKEAKPEDVIDKGDLQVGYDAQQGSYYAYGTYEVAPLDTVEREIELRDVWVIEESELASLKSEAQKIKDLLKGTEFEDRVNFLTDNIISKIEEIEQRQEALTPNPEEHISSYRNNLKLLDAAKSDLAVARTMLDKGAGLPKNVIWKLIIYILVFLGILGGSFYVIWHRQVNMLIGKKETKANSDLSSGQEKEKEEEEEPKSTPDDLEKMLGGE